MIFYIINRRHNIVLLISPIQVVKFETSYYKGVQLYWSGKEAEGKADNYYLADCRLLSFVLHSPHFVSTSDCLKFAATVLSVYKQAQRPTARAIIS